MSDGQTATKKMQDSVSTASISAQLVKRGFRTRSISNIKSISPSANRIFGPAYTLRDIPMRGDLATGPTWGQPKKPKRRSSEADPMGSILIAALN